MDKIKNFLNEEHPGFSGLTHWLIAIFLFFLMWIVPWSFATNYITAIKSSKLFGILIFFVIGGASLLPDLDSSPAQGGGSTAIYQLGVLGYGLSIIAVTISQIVYSLFHTRYDDKPKSQHRMLWHTFLIPILLYLYTVFSIPSSGPKLWDRKNDIESIPMFILVFFAAVSVYLGASMLIYKLLKLIGKASYTQFVCLFIMTLSIIYMMTCNYKQIKLIIIAIALGYGFHIIGDLMTKGSSPIFFPIPTYKNKHLILWKKPYLLGSNFAITTGGTINIIMNFVLMGADIIFAWYLFIK